MFGQTNCNSARPAVAAACSPPAGPRPASASSGSRRRGRPPGRSYLSGAKWLLSK